MPLRRSAVSFCFSAFIVMNRRAFAGVSEIEAGSAFGFTNSLTTLGGANTVAGTVFVSFFARHMGAYVVLLGVTAII